MQVDREVQSSLDQSFATQDSVAAEQSDPLWNHHNCTFLSHSTPNIRPTPSCHMGRLHSKAFVGLEAPVGRTRRSVAFYCTTSIHFDSASDDVSVVRQEAAQAQAAQEAAAVATMRDGLLWVSCNKWYMCPTVTIGNNITIEAFMVTLHLQRTQHNKCEKISYKALVHLQRRVCDSRCLPLCRLRSLLVIDGGFAGGLGCRGFQAGVEDDACVLRAGESDFISR